MIYVGHSEGNANVMTSPGFQLETGVPETGHFSRNRINVGISIFPICFFSSFAFMDYRFSKKHCRTSPVEFTVCRSKFCGFRELLDLGSNYVYVNTYKISSLDTMFYEFKYAHCNSTIFNCFTPKAAAARTNVCGLSSLSWKLVREENSRENPCKPYGHITPNLDGGFNPSEKYESIGMIISTIWKNKKCSKTPTSNVRNLNWFPDVSKLTT